MNDFGYEETVEQIDDANLNKNTDDSITDLNGDKTVDELNDVSKKDTNDDFDIKTDNNDNNNDNVVRYDEGTELEVGDEKYTIDKDGNAVDKDGNIFKNVNEIEDWLKSFEKIEDNTNEINLATIQEALGIDIKDDNDNAIEFENSVEGIKSYINAIIESKRDENYNVAINTLYQKYPFMEDVLNYYLANGNSLKGFGEIPDRSNIVIDDNNEAQQILIIKTAWQEKGISGNVDGYIDYLKSCGTLAATAKEELKSLQEADAKYKQQLADEAEKKENEHIKQLEDYWNGVHDVIKSRKIANYQIPETIVITRNGQKVSATPEDFFNYVYRVDNEGKSAYQKDLENESKESKRDDEILRAYLKFVGGNYSNLVDMAINKQNVNTLKFKASQKTTNKVRINKPTQTKKNNIDLGYN